MLAKRSPHLGPWLLPCVSLHGSTLPACGRPHEYGAAKHGDAEEGAAEDGAAEDGAAEVLLGIGGRLYSYLSSPVKSALLLRSMVRLLPAKCKLPNSHSS